MEHKLIVGIADMKMARDSGMLVTYALGSCIGICLYDPLKKLGAMVHVMLPLKIRLDIKRLLLGAFRYFLLRFFRTDRRSLSTASTR